MGHWDETQGFRVPASVLVDAIQEVVGGPDGHAAHSQEAVTQGDLIVGKALRGRSKNHGAKTSPRAGLPCSRVTSAPKQETLLQALGRPIHFLVGDAEGTTCLGPERHGHLVCPIGYATRVTASNAS